jgi:microcystin-dependent protein
MAYPKDKPSGNYTLRDYNFATLDDKKIPMDEYTFKNGYKNADESEIESVPDAHEQNWLFDVLHRNLKYTQEIAEENKLLLSSKVATPTSIGQVKIGYGLEITSNGVLSVAKDVAADANIISYDLPVGSYMLWSGKNTPEYFIEPQGQTLLRSSYPELWEFAQSNDLVGKLFGEGDGSTTFTVTDIRGNFISIASSDDEVGKFTEAGLPNITGELTLVTGGGSGSGAFSTGTNYSRHINAPTSGVDVSSKFDASLSDSTYGKSNTVTPANWGLKIILKALPTPPSNAVPTGTILDYTGTGAPDGYIVANGAELNRKTFSNLFQWAVANQLIKEQSEIPSTAHTYYGSGDGSTTFTIPDLRGVSKCNSDLASDRNGLNFGETQNTGLINNIYLPDYPKTYSISSGFVAPSNGWIDWWSGASDGGTSALYIDGIEVGLHSSYKYTDPHKVQYVVAKGSSVTFSGKGCSASFTPSLKTAPTGIYTSLSVAVTPILKY